MNQSIKSPWIELFRPNIDNAFIKTALSVRPLPVQDIGEMNASTAGSILKVRLQDIFVTSENVCTAVKTLYGHMLGHVVCRYPDTKTFVRTLNNVEPREAMPIILSGQGGVGKSKLLQRFVELLPGDRFVSATEHYPDVPFQAHWEISGAGLSGQVDALRCLKRRSMARLENLVRSMQGEESGESIEGAAVADVGNEADGKYRKLNVSEEALRRLAYRNGVALLIGDEWQHMTLSSASTSVTKTLVCMGRLGMPAVHVCNYSLVHKLKQRNGEELQRLLSNPIVLEPDSADGEDWRLYLSECVRVANGAIDNEILENCGPIHVMCAGLRRLLIELLVTAYELAREAGRATAGNEDLISARSSLRFQINASLVEALHTQAISGRAMRQDLWCPFELPKITLCKEAAMASEVRDATIAARVEAEMLSPAEKGMLAAVAASQAVGGKPAISKVKGAPSPKRKPLTVDSLNEATNLLLGG